jgi:hypothetical protein
MHVREQGTVSTPYPAAEALRRIRYHLSIRRELLAGLGLAGDVVTGFALARLVFAYPRPRGFTRLDALAGLKLHGRLHSDGSGSTFSWRIGGPRIRAFPDHEGAEEELLRSWVRVVEHDLRGDH